MAHEVRVGRRDQGCKSPEKLDGVKGEDGDTAFGGPGSAQGVQHLAAVGQAEALVGEGWPHAIAAEFFEANAIVRGHSGVGVDRKTIHLRAAPGGLDLGMVGVGSDGSAARWTAGRLTIASWIAPSKTSWS